MGQNTKFPYRLEKLLSDGCKLVLTGDIEPSDGELPGEAHYFLTLASQKQVKGQPQWEEAFLTRPLSLTLNEAEYNIAFDRINSMTEYRAAQKKIEEIAARRAKEQGLLYIG